MKTQAPVQTRLVKDSLPTAGRGVLSSASKKPAQGAPAAPSPQPQGLRVDEKKGRIEGTVQPTTVEGRKQVNIPGMGSLVAPEPGKTDGYLISADKLLSLKSNADGTVTVNTRTMGLEADKKGKLTGNLLPMGGKVDIAGKELDVSGLEPGKSKTKTIKIDGKKYKVKVKMNEDGTVSVEGKRKRSFFSKVAGFVGKVAGFIGKIAPLLSAIPGLGAVALVAKVASGINAVKGFVDSVKTGNFLGAIGSAASFVGGFAKGVVGNIANKIAQGAGFAQQALNTFKHGLGQGFLQVVSNGASLVSGGAALAGAGNMANVAGTVADSALAADSALKGNLGPAAAMLANSLGPKLMADMRRKNEQRFDIHTGNVRFNTRPSASDFGQLPFDPATAQFSRPAPSRTTTASSSRVVSDMDPSGGFINSRDLANGKSVLVAQHNPTYDAVTRMSQVYTQALDAMNRNGNRDYRNAPAVGNIVDNAATMAGGTNKWWKCEDQSPFVADRINQANIPNVRAGIQWDSGHTWVVVNVGGTQNRDGSWSGGTEFYLDPWNNKSGPTTRPGNPIATEWDPAMVRSNIEPDGPR